MSSSLPAEAETFVKEWLGDRWTAQALPGDASVRAYYRIAGPDGRTYMLAYYPPEVRSQLKRFMAAYEAVSQHGRVPDVLQHSDAAVMQRDVGDRTLFDLLHDNPVEGVRLYRAAIDLLVEFQRSPAREINPPFTAGFFLGEMEMTRQYYVEKLMGVESSKRLEPFFRKLAENIAQHSYVLCHRDFHGQNLHVVNNSLYLIDYQDLRLGPDTYDLASLLRDRGVARLIGDRTEIELVDDYAQRSNAPAGVRRRYFETLLQRSIKILGTFARQAIVRARMHYLEFIPPTLESVSRCLQELPEFSALSDLLPMNFSIERARGRAESLKEK
ncbi:MAG: aminoglycoside phosphotransferase family protein [Thermoanaerobaculia bacterium]